MNLNEAAERRSAWVFGSATKDLGVFFLPLLAGLSLHALFGATFSNLKQNFTIYAFFYFVLNTGHIFGTTFPILLDGELRRKVGTLKMWVIPLAVILTFGAICLHDVNLFKIIFGFYTLFHILVQHFNWLRVLQKREPQQNFHLVDRTVFLALILVPISLWCAGQTQVSPSYMHANDISLKITSIDLRVLIWPASVLWAVHLVWIIWRALSSQSPRPMGKILLFATLYPWLFGSLVWLESSLMFFVYTIGSHAAAYYLYLGHGWNRGARAEKIHAYLPLIVPVGCAIIGVVWNKTSLYILTLLPPNLLFVIWIPVILHYVYDGTLWKRTRIARGEGLSKAIDAATPVAQSRGRAS